MKTLLERIVVNFLGKPKEPPVAPKKTLLEQITEEFLSEYTDAEKQKMNIPLDVVSRGGKWYRGDVYAGRVRDGKFVPASQEPEDKPVKTQNKKKNATSTLKTLEKKLEKLSIQLETEDEPAKQQELVKSIDLLINVIAKLKSN